MRKVIVALLLFTLANGAFAQLTKGQMKQVRKEAKKLEKDGWTPAPGQQPVAWQLEKVYTMRVENDENGFPRYIMGTGVSVGNSYEMAKRESTASAMQDLAGQIEVHVKSTIEQFVSNGQMNARESETVSRTLIDSRSQIVQKLIRMIPVMEVYRNGSDKKIEVMVCLAYYEKMARMIARRVAVEAMTDTVKELSVDEEKELERIVEEILK